MRNKKEMIGEFLTRIVDNRTANITEFKVLHDKKYAGLLDYELDDILEDLAIEQFLNSVEM